jgi:hypothetical protein
MCVQFGFEIFWRKDFGAKAAYKIIAGRNVARQKMSTTVTMEKLNLIPWAAPTNETNKAGGTCH